MDCSSLCHYFAGEYIKTTATATQVEISAFRAYCSVINKSYTHDSLLAQLCLGKWMNGLEQNSMQCCKSNSPGFQLHTALVQDAGLPLSRPVGPALHFIILTCLLTTVSFWTDETNAAAIQLNGCYFCESVPERNIFPQISDISHTLFYYDAQPMADSFNTKGSPYQITEIHIHSRNSLGRTSPPLSDFAIVAAVSKLFVRCKLHKVDFFLLPLNQGWIERAVA